VKQKWLHHESMKWQNEGIINDEQRKKILSKYEKTDNQSLIFFFGAILIGLACLTLVAQNWHDIHHLIRMGIILFFLLLFYSLGNIFFDKNKSVYAVTCFIIALSIFGAGIFLSGQMYHYSMNDVLAFFIWGFVAFLVYLSRPHPMIFLSGLLILSAGQIYGLFSLNIFDWSLFALFMLAFGTVVFVRKDMTLSYFFAWLYLIQITIFTVDQFDELYWVIPFILMLYIAGLLVKSEKIRKPFQFVSTSVMFFVVIVQAFVFESNYARDQLDVHYSYYILLFILLIGAFLLTWKDDRLKIPILALFFPVFIIVDYTLLIAYIVLFIISIGKLIEGYEKLERQHVIYGTTAFLISTFIVYFQVAWDYMDRSFFFLIGGLLLIVLGFLLERHRKKYMNEHRKEV